MAPCLCDHSWAALPRAHFSAEFLGGNGAVHLPKLSERPCLGSTMKLGHLCHHPKEPHSRPFLISFSHPALCPSSPNPSKTNSHEIHGEWGRGTTVPRWQLLSYPHPPLATGSCSPLGWRFLILAMNSQLTNSTRPAAMLKHCEQKSIKNIYT